MKTRSTSWSQSTPLLRPSSRLFNELLIADENLFENWKESFENWGDKFCGGSTRPIGGELCWWSINGGFFSISSRCKPVVLSFEPLLFVFEDTVVLTPASVSGFLWSPFILFSISRLNYCPEPCLLAFLCLVGITLPFSHLATKTMWSPKLGIKGTHRIISSWI